MQIKLRIEPAAQFPVFGQDPWPVDVRMDLPVFLEQVPNAIRAIKEHKLAEIDFYEQGIERSIAFEPDGAKYRAICKSWSAKWQPQPSMEAVSVDSLEQMLRAARDEFMRVLEIMAPDSDAAGNPTKRIDFAGRQGDVLPYQHAYDPATKGFGEKQPLH